MHELGEERWYNCVKSLVDVMVEYEQSVQSNEEELSYIKGSHISLRLAISLYAKGGTFRHKAKGGSLIR